MGGQIADNLQDSGRIVFLDIGWFASILKHLGCHLLTVGSTSFADCQSLRSVKIKLGPNRLFCLINGKLLHEFKI